MNQSFSLTDYILLIPEHFFKIYIFWILVLDLLLIYRLNQFSISREQPIRSQRIFRITLREQRNFGYPKSKGHTDFVLKSKVPNVDIKIKILSIQHKSSKLSSHSLFNVYSIKINICNSSDQLNFKGFKNFFNKLIVKLLAL